MVVELTTNNAYYARGTIVDEFEKAFYIQYIGRDNKGRQIIKKDYIIKSSVVSMRTYQD